jgi:hypothetical protein
MIRLHANLRPPSLSRRQVVFSVFLCVALASRAYRRGILGGGRGWAWSKIIGPLESLALYKSFNTLWGVRGRVAIYVTGIVEILGQTEYIIKTLTH